jgi:hypothetical protein
VACRGGGGLGAVGRRPRQGSQPKEEEGRGKEGGEKEKKKRKRKKREKEIGKRKIRKEK